MTPRARRGDALLRVVGHTLGLLVRGWNVMARIGGDELRRSCRVGVFGAQLVAGACASHALPRTRHRPVRIPSVSAAPAGADPPLVCSVR